MRIRTTLLILVLAGGPCLAQAPPDDASLLQGFLPKEDLGVLTFLEDDPESDGRGIIVAILDTGVELNHPALRMTSTGEPKILDVFDGTDDGYLPLPIEVVLEGEKLMGLTGRSLHLPDEIGIGTPVRLGILLGREHFPGGLEARRGRERRAEWERSRQTWEAAAGAGGAAYADAVRDAFEQIVEEDGDPGDRFDIVAWMNGDAWQVLIDTDRDGDLAEETPLGPYGERGEIAVLPDPFNFAVAVERIAPDGSSIFLFFDEGGHGTHVAGIVAGFYGDDNPLNGLAPGAQLLAAKVGNGRFGGSTSHNSITKAAQWAVDHGADVINVSFGGDSFFGDGNELTSSFFNELVEATGVIICSSAGNAGPALSTVGSPGSARRIFAWGASVSEKTQQTNYGTLDPRRDDLFQFTSRGPLLNGDPGVDFISPGAAVSPLPTWGLVKGESWNGTSMASPQGAGLCAIALSVCRQGQIPVSPPRLRRAMRMGARSLPGIPVIEQGDGIPQAGPTLEALEALASAYPTTFDAENLPTARVAPDPVIDWVVNVHNATGTGGGYYERDLRQHEPYRVSFHVRPDFPFDSLQTERADFLRIVALTSEVPWMRVPRQESLHSGGKSIAVTIDPSRLQPGLNVGRVLARDVAHPSAGIEFALVATIIRPETVDPIRPMLEGEWILESGDRRSVFVRVPSGASHAKLRVRELLADPANAYRLALAEPDLVRNPNERDTLRRFSLASGEEAEITIGVVPGGVLEAVAFSRWHHNSSGKLEWRIEFTGVEVTAEPELAIAPDRPGTGFVLGAPTWGADLRLKAKLEREEESLDVDWQVKNDSLFTAPLNGLPAMVQEGTALLSARSGERLTIDLRTAREFEDFLDDCVYRIYDEANRVVASGYLYRGTIGFVAPHQGVFKVLLWVWSRGTAFVDDRTVVSPVVLRSAGTQKLEIYANPIEGFRRGARPMTRVSLVPGERRRFYVRGEDLPENKLLRGHLRVLDSDGSELARIPVRADTRELVPAETAKMLSTNVAASLRRARLLAGRADVTDGERKTALNDLALCERLRIASPQPPEEEDKKKDEEEEPLPPNQLWDLREAAVRLVARGDDLDAFRESVQHLRASLPEVDASKPRTAGDRRRKEAVVELRTAEVSYRKGKTEQARQYLDTARNLDPDVSGGKRLDALLLFEEGKHKKAREAAKRCLKERPDDREIGAVLVHSLLQLGWIDLAELELADWPRRYPGSAAELMRVLGEIDLVEPVGESPLGRMINGSQAAFR